MSNTLAAANVLARNGGHERGGGFLLFLLLTASIIAAVVYLLRRRRRGDLGGDANPPSPPAPPGGGALALLDERFAKGEIDQVEYVGRRAVLTGAPGSAPPVVDNDVDRDHVDDDQ